MKSELRYFPLRHSRTFLSWLFRVRMFDTPAAGPCAFVRVCGVTVSVYPLYRWQAWERRA